MPEALAIPITGLLHLFDCLETLAVCTPRTKVGCAAALFHTVTVYTTVVYTHPCVHATQSQVAKLICLTCRPRVQCVFLSALVTPFICLELQISSALDMQDGREIGKCCDKLSARAQCWSVGGLCCLTY